MVVQLLTTLSLPDSYRQIISSNGCGMTVAERIFCTMETTAAVVGRDSHQQQQWLTGSSRVDSGGQKRRQRQRQHSRGEGHLWQRSAAAVSGGRDDVDGGGAILK
jgi:hypothetical protein